MQNIEQSQLFGGNGGNEFDDYRAAPAPIAKILSLSIRSGKYMDSIQATYQLTDGRVWTAPAHGGTGGGPAVVNLSGQDLIAILLRSGNLTDQTEFVARSGNNTAVYGPFGGPGGGSHSIVGDIVALYGRSGEYLDALGVYGYNLRWSQATVSKEELAVEAESLKQARASAAGQR